MVVEAEAESESPPPPPPPPPPVPPANTALPALSGTVTEGQALSASNGTWTGSPTSFSYKWEDCDASGANCAAIAGATAASYTLTAGDVGHTVRVVVTAANEGGSTVASSAQTETVVAQQSSGGGTGGGGTGGTGGGETCTTTISSVSQIGSSLKAGAVVCLAAGTYGAVSITTTPSSNATLTAAPGAHVVVAGVNIAASNITVSQLHSTGTINVGSGGPYPGFSHDIIEHNDVGPTNGYGISVMSATSTPSSYITIAYNRIHNTSATSEGDASALRRLEPHHRRRQRHLRNQGVPRLDLSHRHLAVLQRRCGDDRPDDHQELHPRQRRRPGPPVPQGWRHLKCHRSRTT